MQLSLSLFLSYSYTLYIKFTHLNAHMYYLIRHKAIALRYKTGVFRSAYVDIVANESGSTSVQHAVRRGDLEVVELLLKHGASVDIKNDLGKTMMSYVITCFLSVSYNHILTHTLHSHTHIYTHIIDIAKHFLRSKVQFKGICRERNTEKKLVLKHYSVAILRTRVTNTTCILSP